MLLDKITPEEPRRAWTPRETPEPVEVKDAYNELGVRAFAIWIRLHTCTTQQLRSGRVRLSRSLGVSESVFNRVARELSSKGYLVVDSRANRNRSTVALTKRARTGGSTKFINL